MNARKWWVSVAASMLAGMPWMACADSMRCGKWVVNEEATPAQIMEKCGAPLEREQRTEDVLAVNALGNRSKVGTTTTERWYYQQGSGSLRMRVTIVDGKVKQIERASD